MRTTDRGVRVRLQVDAMDARLKDAVLPTLDRQDNIEAHLFNAFESASGTGVNHGGPKGVARHSSRSRSWRAVR